MGILVLLRGLLGAEKVSPVSEYQAYSLYLAHIHACPVCAEISRTNVACSTGLELHGQWKRAEAAESPLRLPPRRIA